MLFSRLRQKVQTSHMTQPTVTRHLHQSTVVTQPWRDCQREAVEVAVVACVVPGGLYLHTVGYSSLTVA